MGLFEDFDSVSYQQWVDKIILDLKGKDYQETLVWNAPEGIDVQPFYNKESLTNNIAISSTPLKKAASWKIREKIIISTAEEANKTAITALQGGANALCFVGEIEDNAVMNVLLKDIQTDIIDVHFYNTNPNRTEQLISLKNGSISYDYLGTFFETGKWQTTQDEDIHQLAELTLQNRPIKTITVDAYRYRSDTTNIIQELTIALSQGVEYMNLLTDKKVDPSTIAQKIQFNFSIASNYFFEIAKLRAFRMLWKLILEQYQVDDTETMYIHAETAVCNFSKEDVHNNILKTTTEAMSAIFGGCDSLTVHPFDKEVSFSSRIARNVQHILKEESFLDKVNNPADGAYYIEALTDEIAQKSWSLFQEIEKEGGFLKAIENNFLAKILNPLPHEA